MYVDLECGVRHPPIRLPARPVVGEKGGPVGWLRVALAEQSTERAVQLVPQIPGELRLEKRAADAPLVIRPARHGHRHEIRLACGPGNAVVWAALALLRFGNRVRPAIRINPDQHAGARGALPHFGQDLNRADGLRDRGAPTRTGTLSFQPTGGPVDPNLVPLRADVHGARVRHAVAEVGDDLRDHHRTAVFGCQGAHVLLLRRRAAAARDPGEPQPAPSQWGRWPEPVTTGLTLAWIRLYCKYNGYTAARHERGDEPLTASSGVWSTQRGS